MEKIDCPVCGSDDVNAYRHEIPVEYFNDTLIESMLVSFKCSTCEEEWIENFQFEGNRDSIINTLYKDLKYNPDVARYYGVWYSNLMGAETIREKILILAMFKKFYYRVD